MITRQGHDPRVSNFKESISGIKIWVEKVYALVGSCHGTTQLFDTEDV